MGATVATTATGTAAGIGIMSLLWDTHRLCSTSILRPKGHAGALGNVIIVTYGPANIVTYCPLRRCGKWR
eukprot:3970327-Pleurochrysis_carterae.AAC.1